MTTFRCTAKLMKEAPETDPAPADNRLGEWTATLVRVGRIQLVLAVSEPIRFAVAIDAAPYTCWTPMIRVPVRRSGQAGADQWCKASSERQQTTHCSRSLRGRGA